MDVVANTRAIRGWVVITEDLRALAFFQGAEHHRDQIIHTAVAKLVAACTCNIEVTQGNPRQTVGDAFGLRHPLAHHFGFAIWRFGGKFCIFGYRINFRCSIHSSR